MSHINNEVAIVLLASYDYEALEITLASHAKFNLEGVSIYILQNAKGSYDSEQTRLVARRYARLYPETIKAIDSIEPDSPYNTIKKFLSSEEMKKYRYILKVDDDCFPLTSNWLNCLYENYKSLKEKHEELAYVTPLINNNCWGFREVLFGLGLSDEYFNTVAKPHRVGHGAGDVNPYRIAPKTEIETGMNGTIWGYPYIARWLHEKTTLKPESYTSAVENLTLKEIDSTKRYSIGAIFFEKNLWINIDGYGVDDEDMLHHYCVENNKKIYCCSWVPFVHIAYYSQRMENKDLIKKIKAVYERYLNLNHPISLHSDKINDLESRLRYIEALLHTGIADGRFGTNEENIQKELQRRSLAETTDYVERKMLNIMSVRNRYAVHDLALDKVTFYKGMYLEFGVYKGDSINYISRKTNSTIYGFDSFKGLPEAWQDGFTQGTFALDNLPVVSANVELICGFFSDSLPQFVAQFEDNLRFNGVAYLHIDCDLYSSTKTIFGLLGEFIKKGTVIVFDEYFNYPGWKNHEFKAFQEFVSEKNIKYSYLTYNAMHQQVAVVIE